NAAEPVVSHARTSVLSVLPCRLSRTLFGVNLARLQCLQCLQSFSQAPAFSSRVVLALRSLWTITGTRDGTRRVTRPDWIRKSAFVDWSTDKRVAIISLGVQPSGRGKLSSRALTL